MKRSMSVVTTILALAVTACGGGNAKALPPTPPPYIARPLVADVAAAEVAGPPQPTAPPATSAPSADFCSRVSAADIEALAGPGATAVTGDAATAVAASPSRPRGEVPLAICQYRSDAALFMVSSITLARYDALRTANLAGSKPGDAQPLSDLGTEATIFIGTAPRPFDIAGRAYVGGVVLLVKNGSRAISIGVYTTGSPASWDAEPLKTLARALLQ